MESLLCDLNHWAWQRVLRLSSPGFSTSSNSAFLPVFSLSNYFTHTSWTILIQPMEPNNHLLHCQANACSSLECKKTELLQTIQTHPPLTLPHGAIWFGCCVTLNPTTELVPQAPDISRKCWHLFPSWASASRCERSPPFFAAPWNGWHHGPLLLICSNLK